MRRSLQLLVAMTLAVTGMVALPGSGSAVIPQPISVNPTSGPPGSTFTVSGGGCPAPNSGAAALFSPLDLLGDPIAEEDDDPATDGSWQVPLTVPANATPGVYVVRASCFPPDMGGAGVRRQDHGGVPVDDYIPSAFIVTPAAVPTPAPVPTPTPTFSALPFDLTGPAVPVSGVPTFTG